MTNKQGELFYRAKRLVQGWLRSRVSDTLEDHRRLVAAVYRELQEVAEEAREGKQDFGGWPE